MSKLFSLDCKTVLITGSTRGLGWASARACAEAGATVVLHGRSETSCLARRQELEAAGHKADYLAFDMEDRDAVNAAVPSIIERHGSIWGLVNNAGMLLHDIIEDETAESYERIMAVHMVAPFLLTRAAAAEMKKTEGPDRGRIVNIASIALFQSPFGHMQLYISQGCDCWLHPCIIGRTRKARHTGQYDSSWLFRHPTLIASVCKTRSSPTKSMCARRQLAGAIHLNWAVRQSFCYRRPRPM